MELFISEVVKRYALRNINSFQRNFHTYVGLAQFFKILFHLTHRLCISNLCFSIHKITRKRRMVLLRVSRRQLRLEVSYPPEIFIYFFCCMHDHSRKLACHLDNHLQSFSMFLVLKQKQARENSLVGCTLYLTAIS